MRRRTSATITGLAALALPVLFVAVPLALWLAAALPHDAARIDALPAWLSRTDLQAAFLRTAAIGLLACGLASLVAVPIGCVLGRCLPRRSRLALLFGVLPLLVPPMLTAAALREHDIGLPEAALDGFLAYSGLRAADVQLILVYALHYFPLLMLSVAAALRRLAGDADEAAQTLGAGRWVIWHRILLPLAMPGFALGACLMLLRILEDPATPLLLGIDGMLAPQLLIGERGGATDGIGPTVLMLAIAGILVVFGWRALSPLIATPQRRGKLPRRVACRFAPGFAAALVLGFAAILVLAPYVATLLAAADTAPLADPAAAWRTLPDAYSPALAKSLLFATFAGLLALLGATLVGVAVASGSPASRLVRVATSGVLAVPTLVLALALNRSTQQFWGGDGPVNMAWVLLALIVAIKLLPLGQYLIGARAHAARPALQDTDILSAQQHRRGTLGSIVGGQLLIFVLAFTALLGEVPAAMLLLHAPDVSVAVLWFDDMLAADAWQMPSVLLLTLLVGMLGMSLHLWQPAWQRGATRNRRHKDLLDTL